MEATAKYDYEATAGDELGFSKGDQLMILDTTGNWYTAELGGVKGVVPKNFISFHQPGWYEEDTSSSEAREKLMSRPPGAFVMRGTQNGGPGEFSMSVRQEVGVLHFKVLRDPEGQFSLWTEKFPSLNQLVTYYKTNSVTEQAQIFLLETNQRRRGSDALPPLPSTPPSLDHQHHAAPPQHVAPSAPQVRAQYSFGAKETDELEFSAGDVIEVLECLDQAWWRGRLRGKTGLFPSNHTQPI